MTNEQRIVICAFGSTPHIIDDECQDVVDVSPLADAITTKWCAHGPAHRHGEGGQCPHEPGPAPDPQQPDAPPLLDLVRQYGAEREAVGAYTPDRGELQRDKAQRAIIAANMLLFHIAALVPQQPVQARDHGGRLLWQHSCGATMAMRTDPAGKGCWQCVHSGRWRPLLIGGTWKPAKPGDTPGQLVPGEADVPQPVDVSPLLDLVRQHGSQRYMHGLDMGAGLPDAQGHKAAADALLARIAALAPTLPLQARNAHGQPWWIHECGAAWPQSAQPAEDECLACTETPGSWRPLLVGDPAPQQPAAGAAQARDEDGEPWWIHACGRVRACAQQPSPHACDDDTSLWRPLLVGGDPAPEIDADRLDEARGDYEAVRAKLREVVAERDRARAEVERQQPRPVAEALADDRDRVLKALANDRALITQLAETGQRLRAERDEARAEVEQLRRRADGVDEMTKMVDRFQGERDEARAEVERLKSAARVVEMADAIAAKRQEIGPILLDMSAQPGPPPAPRTWPARPPVDDAPDDLRAVRFVETGQIFRRRPGDGRRWWDEYGTAWDWSSLRTEALEEVTEQPKDRSRTAAEIWATFSDDDRRRLVNTAELAEALNREAGL